MSLIIKGMELPKSCDSCDLIQFDDEGFEAHCPLSPYYRWCGTPPDYRPEGCRLVEIPTPHGRLIDADELFCEIDGIKGWDYGDESDIAISAAEALSAIDDAPTIVEAEVSE